MTARPALEQLPAGTELLRNLRQLPDEQFAEFTDDELGNAVRWLYAARYSCLQGAIKLGRILNARDPYKHPIDEKDESHASLHDDG